MATDDVVRNIIARNRQQRESSNRLASRLTVAISEGSTDDLAGILDDAIDELRDLSPGDDSSRQDDGAAEAVVGSAGPDDAGAVAPTPDADT